MHLTSFLESIHHNQSNINYLIQKSHLKHSTTIVFGIMESHFLAHNDSELGKKNGLLHMSHLKHLIGVLFSSGYLHELIGTNKRI